MSSSSSATDECDSDISSDFSEDEAKETEDQVPLEQFAKTEHFAATLELLQLPPAERSREDVSSINKPDKRPRKACDSAPSCRKKTQPQLPCKFADRVL